VVALLEDPVVVGQARPADDGLLAMRLQFLLLLRGRLSLLLPGLLEQQGAQACGAGRHGVELRRGGRVMPRSS
jgi:hypothetical protein